MRQASSSREAVGFWFIGKKAALNAMNLDTKKSPFRDGVMREGRRVCANPAEGSRPRFAALSAR
jgi:hypothetical protein